MITIWILFSTLTTKAKGHQNNLQTSKIIPRLLVLKFLDPPMKSVCFRERWGKCSMRCIVKFYFVTFTSWISTFDHVYFLVNIWNNAFKEKYRKLRYSFILSVLFVFSLEDVADTVFLANQTVQILFSLKKIKRLCHSM